MNPLLNEHIRPILADKFAAAGANVMLLDKFLTMVALPGVRPESAMLRIIADYCWGDRPYKCPRGDMVAKLRVSEKMVRQLAEIYAARRMIVSSPSPPRG